MLETQKTSWANFSPQARVAAVSGHASCNLAGESVILDMNKGVYYGLNPVGAFVWDLIQTPTSVAAIQDAIQGEYDVAPDLCAQDLQTLLVDLARNGLITISEPEDR